MLIIGLKRRGILMKTKLKKSVLEFSAKMIKNVAVKEANSACVLFSYQPEVPEKLKKKDK